MSDVHSGGQKSGSLLSLSTNLSRAETVEAAVTHVLELARTAFDEPVVAVSKYDVDTGTYTTVGSTEQFPSRTESDPDEIPKPVLERTNESTNGQSANPAPRVVVEPDPSGSIQREAFVPVGRNRVLRLGTTDPDGLNDADVTLIEGIAATLETALRRLDGRKSERRGTANRTEDDATAFRRLNELTTGSDESDETIERLLSLGCEYLGLDTGILSHVDGDKYEVEAVVDATGSHEAGAVYDLGDTMCDATLAGDVTETLAFADIADTDYQNHPAADSARAYIAVPVVVDHDTYGTVNFSMGRPRSEAFRPEETEFVKLVAQWIGVEIDRRHRLEELERYETILEAVDDAVYALDADGQFTFANEAAKREFGYDAEVLGERPSVGVGCTDVEQIEEQTERLLDTGVQSTTEEFELETADGDRKTVENRLALIGDSEFCGTAGVLRDITRRKERRRQLESLQRAVEEAADGIAILDGGEYTYVDQSHVEMYGLEDKDQLLGNTWRKLYDDDEVERLEREAFPALEADGHWRGTVTGSRPDGSTFPAELSLTIIDDGRLVCTVRDETERRKRERELESFQRAVESARDGVAILDGDEYTYVDQSHVEMYGFEDKDQLLGNTWRKLYDSEEVERLEAEAFPALEADGYWRGMVTGSRPDGSTFPAELSLTVVDDGRLVCTVRDETERRARERELELKERAMDETTVGIQITDPTREDNPLVYVNDGFERMTGYTSDDVIGRNPRFLQDADSDSEQVARFREAIDSGEPVSCELQNHRKDGTPYWSRISVTPVTDEDGTVTNYVGIQQDVTERKEREQKAQARIDLLERIYEVTTDQQTGFEEKINGLLEAGSDYLDLPYGFLTQIDMDDDPTAGTQTILEAVGSHELLQPDESGPLSESYCQRIINQDDVMSLTSAAESELVADTAYETFGLETYIGGNVVVGNDVYGTLCFASNKPGGSSFDEFERTFVGLLGQWAGYEIERRSTREDLRQQQERLELTLSGTNTGIVEWDLETDELTSDDTVVDLVGTDAGTTEEFFQTVVHPDDRERVREALERNLDAGEPTKAEYRIQTADEETRWLQSRAVPTLDDDGNPRSVLGMLTDISDRKAEARKRRRNERRFESLFEDPGMLVGLLDTDGTLLNVNATAMKYVEGTTADVLGEPFPETPWWNHSDALQNDLCEWIERAADGEYVEYSATHRSPDGDRIYIDGTVRPVTDADGTVTSLVISGRDVTEREQQRRELRDRQQKLDLVLSNTGTTFAEFDLAAGSVQWDETMGSSEFGSPETLDEFFETIHPDDRERVRSEIETVGDSDEPNSVEFRFVGPDSSVVWVVGQAVPITDDEGNPTERVIGIATDITEIKQREQALEYSQQRYQTLLQAAPDPVVVADAETGDIVEVNAAAKEMRGQSREDLLGLDQTELHPGEDLELYREVFEQSIGTSTIVSKLPDGTQPKFCSADGEVVPVEINAASAQLPDGPVIYGVFRDISERRERERELELKQRAMNETNVGITISDPDREDNPLIYVNDGFVHQTGYTREDALGRNCRFLQAGHRDQPALDTLRDAVEAEEPVTVQLRNYRKDGEQFWNRLSVTPVYDKNGTLANYIGVQRDVTQKVTREQRMQALHGTTRELLGADDGDEAVAKALDSLTNELNFYFAGIYLRERDELVRAGTVGPATEELPDQIERGRTPPWRAIEADRSVVIDDYSTLDDDDVERGDASKRAYVPVGERGVIVVDSTDDDRLNESEQQLVEVLAGNLASVLDTLARQRKLFEERERFRLLTGSVDEYAFLTVDGDERIQTWNAGAENLFGYDADTAIGISMAELYPESDRESGLSERLLQQARIGGESAHEGWQVRADGSEFYADIRYAPLESDDGEFRGYAMIVRDMTDKRRQRRRTERFVEEANDVVTIVDTDGSIEYASGSADRILGYDPDDIIGENLFDYLHPESREDAMETFFTGLEDPDADLQAEWRIESGNGEWLSVEGQCRNMLDDDAIGGMLLYLRDVTESRKRARRFESIFNQTFQFTGLLEPDGTVVEMNDAALEFGGFENDEVVGRPFFDVPWWTHSEAVYDEIRDAIDRAADGEFIRYETEVRGDEGLAMIDFSVKPVRDDDDVSLLVVEGRDITAQQQRRRHLEVMQRVMRHNMRNDLTKVRGWTQVMSEEADAETRAEQFGTVERILDKWESMTEKMAEIRRVLRSQNGEEITTESNSLIEDAARPVREKYDNATILTEASSSETIQAPASLLKAVRELVDNAADASEGATVEVEISCSEDGWIEIDVRDDGPGMPEMEADVLETGEETPLNHGQGLGLWMVRMIVTQAGGDVWVESTTDGTEIRLRVPRVRRVETERITRTAE